MLNITEITNFVLTNIWSVLPYFAISIALSVLIHKLEFDGYIRQAFNKSIGLSILLATVVGAFSPFCSCTVVPIVSGLLLSGVPLAPVMAFWIASPTMDPEMFALTVGVLGWPLAVIRLLATLALSLSAGYATLLLTRSGFLRYVTAAGDSQTATASSCCSPSTNMPEPIPQMAFSGELSIPLTMAPAMTSSCSSSGCSVPASSPALTRGTWHKLQSLDWSEVGLQMLKESWRIGRWLIVAFLLEALIVNYIPQEAIASVLGQDNPLAVVFAAFVGIPLYLSNYSALPIVSGLLAQGMQPGAATAFLIAGPVTTIPAMTAVWGVVQRRVFALYLTAGLVGAIIMGVLTNLWFAF